MRKAATLLISILSVPAAFGAVSTAIRTDNPTTSTQSAQSATLRPGSGTSGPAVARPVKPPAIQAVKPVSRWSLLDFKAGWAYLSQASYGGSSSATSGAPLVAWTPSYALSSRLFARAGLGLGLVHGSANDLFATPEAQLQLGALLGPRFDVVGGGGAVDWLSHGGIAPIVCAELAFRPYLASARWWRRVYVGYARVFATVPSDEITGGIGLHF